jgi:hypothetical protein
MSFQNYNVYDGLTSVRLVQVGSQAGTYYNGPLNNGVGATFTSASSTFTIDGLVVQVGDSVLLQNQANAQNCGIYICVEPNILQRRPDFQSVEQMRAGQFVTVGDGNAQAGSIYTLINPLPSLIGIDPINFVKS